MALICSCGRPAVAVTARGLPVCAGDMRCPRTVMGGVADGIPLNSIVHPDGSIDCSLAADDISPASVEVVEWEGPEPAELRPPPEHEGKALHWVQQFMRPGTSNSDVNPIFDSAPLVWRWVADLWSPAGQGCYLSPQEAAAAGYRYLGPAEWIPASGIYDGAAEAENDERLKRAEDAERLLVAVRAEVDRLRGLVRKGVHVDPCARSGAHLIWWPDELPIPLLPESVAREAKPAESPASNYITTHAEIRAIELAAERATIFRNRRATMEQVLDNVITEVELTALGWQPDVNRDVWSAVEDQSAPAASADNSPSGVKADLERTIDHLLNGRTTKDQRKGLSTATERAERVPSGSDAAVGRAVR